MSSPEAPLWKEAVNSEVESILQNHTWELMDLPPGYCDANWISDTRDSKSTSGYVFTLGGAAVSWKSSKQTCIARSTMESEFIALDKAGEEAEWLRHFLEDIPIWPKSVPAICIHCDNQSAIGRAQSHMIEEWALNTIHVVLLSFQGGHAYLSHLILRFLRNVDLKSPPSSKPINGVSSSDINVDPSCNLWFRLYLPPTTTTTLLPLLIYFHGGRFLTSAANSKVYDHLCRNLAAHLQVTVASVNYRLAPNHRYTSQYDDDFETLKFIDAHNYAILPSNIDLNRCFLAGDSAGGNIAHHVAVRYGRHEFEKLSIIGLVEIQPFFGGEERSESELRLSRGPFLNVKRTDWMWRLFLPIGADRNHEAVRSSVQHPARAYRHRFTLECPKIRSSAGCTLPEFSADDQNAERRKFTLERPSCRSSVKVATKARSSLNNDREYRDRYTVSGGDVSEVVKLPATLVAVGGGDPLQDWQRRYVEGLKKSGKEVKLIEYPNAIHGFYIFPELPQLWYLIAEVRDFIQSQFARNA
ncbi:hypothetical protein HYC85_017332 [Camellia sinensis]|uniref:Alpha/beta hydrolase fold-3 domain-containing protein n=1 Tax=Camellia sinensis TaxID=4442 RepID=A0A7J7H5H5_CAMSI|nr:hypothetical protein HYC85_017332 [Camellia sinensis]